MSADAELSLRSLAAPLVGIMGSALQRTASNRPPSDDGDDWSDSD